MITLVANHRGWDDFFRKVSAGYAETSTNLNVGFDLYAYTGWYESPASKIIFRISKDTPVPGEYCITVDGENISNIYGTKDVQYGAEQGTHYYNDSANKTFYTKKCNNSWKNWLTVDLKGNTTYDNYSWYGVKTDEADVAHGVLNMKSGKAKVVSGGYASVSGNASGNHVILQGGSVTDVYGGIAATGAATDNNIHLLGGTVTNIHGGKNNSGITTGNTLTTYTFANTVSLVDGVDNLNFIVADRNLQQPMLTINSDNPTDISNLNIKVGVVTSELYGSDVITLLHNEKGFTGTPILPERLLADEDWQNTDAKVNQDVVSEISKALEEKYATQTLDGLINYKAMVVVDEYNIYLKIDTDGYDPGGDVLWYTIGTTEYKYESDDTIVKDINVDVPGDVTIYRGTAYDNIQMKYNQYGEINANGHNVTIESKNPLTVTGNLTADTVMINADRTLVMDSGKKLTTTNGVNNSGTLNVNAGDLLSKVANNGTVNLGAGILATGKTITGGTLNINGDVTANAGDIMGNTNAVAKGKTLTLNGGTIAKTISGEGTLKVMANMSVNADNLQTSTTFVESGKTLTITDGTFDKKVGGDGTLKITGTLHFGNNAELVQTGTQTVGDRQIPVSNVNITLASGGTFDVRDRENTTGGCINTLTFDGGRIDASGGHVGNMLVANTLDATGGGSISFDVAGTGADGTNTNDQIGFLNSVAANSKLKLDSINVVGELAGDSGSIDFVQDLSGGSALDNLTIEGETTTMSGNYMYKFTTGENGKLNYTKETGMGLMQVIQAKDINGNYMDSYAKVATYSFTGDRGKNFEPYSQSKIDTLSGDAKTNAENMNKRFGNLGEMKRATGAASRTLTIVGNGSELSGGTYEGVTVNEYDILVLKNISAITDAKDNVIATNKGTVMFTGSGTTDVRATIKGSGTLIVDGVNVVLGENYQYVKDRQQLTEHELEELGNKTDRTAIEQKEYDYGWKLNADGSYVTTLSENTSASITQKDLEIRSGSLTANADNLHITNGIVNNGEMTFTGGTLSTELKGAGQYSNIGTMTVEDTSKLKMTNGLENTGTLNLGNSTNSVLGADITGTGTTVIAGNVSNNDKTITQNTLNITGTFSTNADKLVIAKVINNSGNVSFNGGTLAQKVQGTGNITFDGNVTTNANYIATTGTNTVASGKTLTFNAGTLAKKIEGAGNLSFGGNVTTNADNIATEGTNEVTSSAKLAFAGGTLTKAITGDGTAEFNGTVCVADGVQLGTATNNVNGTLDLAGHITTGTINFKNGSTLKVDGTKITETAAITGITSATVASGAKLYVSNAEKDTAYKILAGIGGIDVSSWTTDDNMGEGFRASYGLVVDTDNTTTAGTGLSEFHIQFKEDPVATGSSDIGNIIANLPAGSEAKVWIDNISANQPDVQTQGNIVNTMANMNSLANVQQGTQAVMAMATDALQTNIGTGARPMLGHRGQVSGVRKSGGLRNVAVNAKDTGKIETVEQGKSDEVMPTMVENEEQKYDKTVWANYIHSKKTIDGLKTGHLTQNSTIQYNGVTVGADLWSNAKGFGGLALTTAEGKTNSSQNGASVKNDTDYHGVSLYQRYDYKDVAILFDLSYTHAKNDVTMSTAGTTDVTAKPKSDAYSAGVKVEYPVKIGHSSQLTPYTGVRYTHIHTDKYDNSLGISNDIKDQNLVNIPIGVQLKTEYTTNSDWKFGHIFEGGYVWNVGNRQSEQRLGYLGVYDSIDFDVTDRGEYFLKTALTANHKDTDFELGYRFTRGDNTKDNKWNFNVTYNFGNANGMPYKSVLLGKIDLLESANKALRAELVEVKTENVELKAENERKDVELAEKDAEIERLKALLRAKG